MEGNKRKLLLISDIHLKWISTVFFYNSVKDPNGTPKVMK